MNTYVAIQLKVKPGSHQTLKDVLTQVRQELPTHPDCSTVTPLTQQDDKSSFLVLELWRSREAHERHVAQLRDSGAWAQFVSLLSVPPVTTYFTGPE